MSSLARRSVVAAVGSAIAVSFASPLLAAGQTVAKNASPGPQVAAATQVSGKVAETKAGLRDLWVGHIFWVRGVVFATFAKQPFAFKAVTGDGDITASIPDGKRTYAVTAKSTSGHVSSQIDSDQDGAGFIRATSDSGDISLRMQ